MTTNRRLRHILAYPFSCDPFCNIDISAFPLLKELSERTAKKFGKPPKEKFTKRGETIKGVLINFKIEESKRNDEGRGLVVFNSSGYLEIAVYKSNCSTVGSASTLMGLKTMDTVTVNFSKT